ncbi:PREDICTED: VQ motif-containing protein 20-like [Nicotiana attenuata]|uniref:Vq motif-containing protein 20 n=1 Tax=Nicotiana attenuata TaxID=49451 RepID=A0A1J6IM49_NICAT|nr:PREDICTED: VQ motif-containing protein 20-like [Nicotiana attenuata]OIT05340.1 vq motif-containing protein 20 [Nicotiana attenuata]
MSPPLKMNRDSCHIKKPSFEQQQRHPVIFYTHSPKIIRTHPRDFMALVQNLTGFSRSEKDLSSSPYKSEPNNYHDYEGNINDFQVGIYANVENELNSDENNSISYNNARNIQLVSEIKDTNSEDVNYNDYGDITDQADLLCSAQSLFNYTDSLFFMRSMKELPDY